MLFGGNDKPRRRKNDKPALTDHAKVAMLVLMRRGHARTLGHTSATIYRRRRVQASPAPRLVSAARAYRGMGWLPAALVAPEKLPAEAKLPPRYVGAYYAIGKAVWGLYGSRPITTDLPWDPESRWNEAFPKGPLAWGDPSDEASFVRLRLQGPNPFMLKAVGDTGNFELDFSGLFKDIFAETIARFTVDTSSELGLRAESISIGEATYRPRDADRAGWETAKRIVNALDARAAAFVRHLLNTHLMVGQSFAVAAYTLPVWHPLRPFMDFFTYGTLQVNHYAYKALLTPNSYFIRSNFLPVDDARKLIGNAMGEFDFDEWVVPRDIAKRGIAAIPNHPYVADAELVWPALERIVEQHLDDLMITDADVVDDPHLVSWYATVRQVLPDSGTAKLLDNRQDLETLMTGLLYNNVIHEICGNLSPILGSRDEGDKVGINLDHLRSLADPARPTERPKAAEVLLMDQASYVSSFNVAGNNLMGINAAKYIDDPRLRDAVVALQATLRGLDQEIATRNRARAVAFTAMEPHTWEVSVSF